MKVYEQMIKNRLVPVLEERNCFSPAQAAYRKGRSTVDHLFVLQELFFHYRYAGRHWDRRRRLNLCFLDLRKAFDSVPRKRLFYKLRTLGLEGKMLRVIQDLFTSNPALVRIGEFKSNTFEINSGVMQGSKLGPILFSLFINDLLDRLHHSTLGATLGGVTVSGLGFADDIILVADNESSMKALIKICEIWSRQNGMLFNISKCKAMVLNGAKEPSTWSLYDEALETTNSYKYLGVTISSTRLTSLYTEHFNIIEQKVNTRVNCIRHFGFSRDGLRPFTCIRMYKVLVRPILEYAAQTLSYRHYYFNSTKTNENCNRTLIGGDSFSFKLEKLQFLKSSSLVQKVPHRP